MSNAPQDDKRVQDFLYEATDVMLEHPLDVSSLAYKHNLAVDEATGYTDMLLRLDASLVDVQPSKQFRRELRKELLGEPQRTVLGRLRNLPPRLQWAAGVALLAAMALLGRKRFSSEIQKLLQQLRSAAPVRDTKAAEVNVSAG
jgi:hypothetical protein